MALTVTAEAKGSILWLTAVGRYSLADFTALIEALKAQAEQSNCERVLLDIRAISGEVSDMDRFFIGKFAAEQLSHRIKVAAVYHAQKINRFAENVAVNRGARVGAFATEQDALTWLEAP